MADSTYKDLQILEFNIKLATNQYMNWNSVYICLPIKIKGSANEENTIAANMITVNNFFAHRIKEIDIKHYGDDLQTLPFQNYKLKIYKIYIYRYSDAILKYMLKDTLKTFKKFLLYS